VIDIQTLPDRRTVSPAEVEAALLDGYAAFVRLAYLILPSSLGRQRRILAAHNVVQHALPDHRRLERQLAGESDARAFVRRRVIQSAIRQAGALRLFPRSSSAGDRALRRLSPDARAAWALMRAERLSVDDTEYQLRAMGIQNPQAAINEAVLLEEDRAAVFGALVFEPCATRLAPTDLVRHKACGRAVAITATVLLSVAILACLIATAS